MSNVDRKPGHSIQAEFYERWSPRAFTAEEIPEDALMRGFEAARWAPSSGNSQPWRFLYARRGSPDFEKMVKFLMEGNRPWAKNAAALILILSKVDFQMGDKWTKSASHSFDAGSGWMSFALQMHADGWATHAMGGIERDEIRKALALPENYAVETMVAVGRLGPKDSLPENYRAREGASQRNPLATIVSEGASLPATWI